jgi:hypothetical protein
MRTTGHWISFFLTLVMMTALIIFIYRGRGRRVGKGNNWYVYGPTILAVVATILIMADLWRHVLQDTGVWPEKIFSEMKQADIVVGYQTSPTADTATSVGQYYSPENGKLEQGSLAISNQVFEVQDFNMTLCFDRPVQSGHHDAGDESFIIWALGTHSYTLDSLKHSADPLDRQDSNPTMNWLSDQKPFKTLSDPKASNQVSLWWTKLSSEQLRICLTATGPLVTSRAWLGLGFTKPLGIGSSQYVFNPARNCMHDNNERVGCLSTIGAIFTIVFTYSGFVLLAISTMWNANITEKIKKFREKWKEIREMKK